MTSGIALNCLHSENILYGRLATESSNDLCVEFAVKRGEFVCILGRTILLSGSKVLGFLQKYNQVGKMYLPYF